MKDGADVNHPMRRTLPDRSARIEDGGLEGFVSFWQNFSFHDSSYDYNRLERSIRHESPIAGEHLRSFILVQTCVKFG